MRELIARTLAGVFLVLALRQRGRRTAAAPASPAPVSPWSRPWTSPDKDEARRLFARMGDRELLELVAIRERRRAVVAVGEGRDYPYIYPGAPFRTEHFDASADITA